MTKKHVSKNTKLSYKRNKRNTHRNTRKHTRRNTRLKQYNIKTQRAGSWFDKLREKFKKKVSPVTVASGTETTPLTKAISAWGASGSASSTSVLSDVSGSTSTTNNSLELTHVWYRIWPDHGVPIMEDFRPFMDTLYKNIYKTNSFGFTKDGIDTIIIHCSAGVGRSGVLLIILQLKKLKEDNPGKTIEAQTIIDAITKARINRMKIVQTSEQFEFICKFFNVVYTKLKPITEYIDEYNKLQKKSDETTEIAGINNQYNRYVDILPYDNKRVIIINDENYYINASQMEALTINGFTIKIILAQGPKNNTLQHFLKMCYEHNVRLIIMLTDLIENTKNKCDDYMDNDLKKLEIDFNKDTNPVLYTQYTLTHNTPTSTSPSEYTPKLLEYTSTRIRSIPVGADEDIFGNPSILVKNAMTNNKLRHNANYWLRRKKNLPHKSQHMPKIQTTEMAIWGDVPTRSSVSVI